MSYYQTIYNRLRQAGFTEAAVLGFLGNWQQESGCEPYRLQNDFNSFRAPSKDYTARVESGAISRAEFSKDQKGYGLAQWTYYNFTTGQGRKQDLYDFWKKYGGKLDSVVMQVDFALWELTTQAQYSSLLQLLKTTDDVWTATDKICRLYEQPYYCNVQDRYKYALEIKAQIDLNGWQSTAGQAEQPSGSGASGADPGPEPEPSQPKLETWPPRVIDSHCSGWPEVWLLQALLKSHGLNVLVDGIFGDALSNKVRQWQKDNGLTPDGAVGPMTWTSLGISPEAFKK